METPFYKEADVLTLFQWIKKTLTEEGEIEDIKKEKFNYTADDYLKTVSSLWTRDSPVFFHGLLKILIVFALQVFLFTGARIGAFIPDAKKKKQRGLRYKVNERNYEPLAFDCVLADHRQHIELVLFRSANEPWRIGWRINQQWLKNNRNPNYTV